MYIGRKGCGGQVAEQIGGCATVALQTRAMADARETEHGRGKPRTCRAPRLGAWNGRGGAGRQVAVGEEAVTVG